MKFEYFWIWVIMLSVACTKQPDRLEESLHFAGANRVELEKVLNHYKIDPKDSLKYRAAVFLIENMPYYYALHNERLDQYRTALYSTIVENNSYGTEAIKILENKYGKLQPDEYKKVYDSHVITSFYLINNIEQAFHVWEHQPWAKQINFSDFCEQILPYRISCEPLENWREIYYNTFQPIIDSLLTDKNDAVAAMNLLYDTIVSKRWSFYQEIPLPYMGACNLLTNRVGNCTNRTELATCVMRSLGIPGGTDFILLYPNRGVAGHAWNFAVDTSGHCVPFSLYEERPGQLPRHERKRGKIYRKCFGLQLNSLPLIIEKNIPPVFQNPFMRDVSSEYFLCNEICIPVKSTSDKILYLAIFDNQKWTPFTWTRIHRKKKQAVFQWIEEGIVYLPCYYEEDKLQPVSSPLLLHEDGSVQAIKADTKQKQSLYLVRKYSIQPWWSRYLPRAIGGKFQGANRPDFSDAVTFHTITDSQMQWYQIPVNIPSKYRYVRYLSSPGGYCNMAELQFFSDTLLTGKIIGTDGSYENKKKYTKYAVFDNDPLTFYDAMERNNGWTGLDLGNPQIIKAIHYLFRNDDNNIRIGDEYELFYWNENRWNSLGKQTAIKDTLQYDNCPTGALFLLRNYSRGKEERIFTYENEKQMFW